VAQFLSEFVPLARVKGAYGADQASAEQAVRDTAIDFCERTGVWQFEFEFFLQQGVSDYPIFTPEFTRVLCVDWVQIDNDRKRRAERESPLCCQCGTWNITIPNNRTVMITPAPYVPCQSVVRMRIWLVPMQEACELPNFLYQEYSDTIAYGASARLLMQPKQDYTNQGLAARHMTLYEGGVTRAKNKRVLERTTGPIMMRGSYF
jgi:hypothetical protein